MYYFWMLESFFLFCIFGYTISSIMAKREGFCFRLVMNMTLHILGYSKSRKGEFTQMLMSSFLCIPNMFGSSQTSAGQSFYSVLTARFASYSRSYKFLNLWSDLLLIVIFVARWRYCCHYSALQSLLRSV